MNSSFFQRIIVSGAIAASAALGSLVTEVKAATFTLPIEPAAKATGIDVLRDVYGLDGEGVTIGVLSDSFNTAETFDISGNIDTYATNIADSYLPSDIEILQDYNGPDATDEGRAMSQLIHAIAPEADIAFYTSEGGVDVFTQGILALADAGADIIVDDRSYVPSSIPDTPPNFLDLEPPNGSVNQAIDAVVEQGVSYFTDAGNNNFPPDSGISPFPIYGHANNPNALTIGAVYYGNANSYSNRAYDLVIEQGQLEPFSSRGNIDSLKPDVIAPDGLPISFNLGGDSPRFANPNFFDFFGTSASSPFTAAVAALLLQADPSATPTEIYDALRNTAESPSSGFDSGLGFGLIQADRAIEVLDVNISNPETVAEPSASLALLSASVLFFSRYRKRNLKIKKVDIL